MLPLVDYSPGVRHQEWCSYYHTNNAIDIVFVYTDRGTHYYCTVYCVTDGLHIYCVSNALTCLCNCIAKPEHCTLIYATMALVVSTVCMLAQPYFFGLIINTCSDGSSDRKSLNQYAATLIVVILIGGLFTSLRGYLYMLVGERLVRNIRLELFNKIIHQDMAFFDTNKTGELMNRLSSDTTVIQSCLSSNVSLGLRSMAQVVVSITLLFVTSWELTLIMMAVVPAIVVVVSLYGRLTKQLTKAYQDALAHSADTGSESISNARIMRSFGAEALESSNYSNEISGAYSMGARRSLAYGFFVGGLCSELYIVMCIAVYSDVYSYRCSMYVQMRHVFSSIKLCVVLIISYLYRDWDHGQWCYFTGDLLWGTASDGWSDVHWFTHSLCLVHDLHCYWDGHSQQFILRDDECSRCQ